MARAASAPMTEKEDQGELKEGLNDHSIPCADVEEKSASNEETTAAGPASNVEVNTTQHSAESLSARVEAPTRDDTKETDNVIRVGDRLHLERDDSSSFTTASVFMVKQGGPVLIVYDDMFWAGFHVDDLEKQLKDGMVHKVKEEDDTAPSLRARAFLSPYNGSPPDSFLFDELKLPEGADSWRWFRKLLPAPKDGTFAQRFSPPRMSHILIAGAVVTLCGRVTKLLASKRTEAKELLTTETQFSLLGLVQAELPTQRNFWVVVRSRPLSGEGHIYCSSMFGKSGENHIKSTGETTDEASIVRWTSEAVVSAHKPCVS